MYQDKDKVKVKSTVRVGSETTRDEQRDTSGASLSLESGTNIREFTRSHNIVAWNPPHLTTANNT